MDDTVRDVGMISMLCLDIFKVICYNVTKMYWENPSIRKT